MHHGVPRHAVFEIRQFGLARQFAVKQQIAHFEIRALVRQLLDRIAAIKQFALVAVDIGDGAVARSG